MLFSDDMDSHQGSMVLGDDETSILPVESGQDILHLINCVFTFVSEIRQNNARALRF